MDGPVPLPQTRKEPEGHSWLPYVPPPIGVWHFTGTIDGRHDSWDLLCHPVFEARITRGAQGTFALALNGQPLGNYRNIEVAKQRAEREIVQRARGMMGALNIIRQRLRSSPTAAEPPPPPAPKIAKSYRDRYDPRCKCGREADYALYGRRETTLYCVACLPDDQQPWLPEEPDVCNLYSMTKPAKAIRDLARAMHDMTNGQPPLPAIFPNRVAPIVRAAENGERSIEPARWGFPPPNIPGRKPKNPYLTNVRKTDSTFWKPWLKDPFHRCLVPVTSFSEPDNTAGDDKPSVWTWFAKDDSRPLMFFAGIWREWEGDRGTKTAPVPGKHLLYSFLTTDAAPDIKAVHPDATPVLLLTEEDRETWMTAPVERALELQRRPMPAGTLKVVARGEKQDG